MKCAKCGLDLPSNTRQCPKCGSINEFEQAPAVPKKKNPMMVVIIALAVVGLLALAIYAMSNKNVTSAPSGVARDDTNITTAPPGKPGEGGIVTAPPGKVVPEKTPEGVKKPKPPQSVVDYLAHVKKIEEHRQMLLKDTSAALLLAIGGQAKSYEAILDSIEGKGDSADVSDPMSDMRKELSRQYGNWLATVKYFDQKAAPPECREFAGYYRAVIAYETETIKREVQIVSKVDVSKGSSISDGLTAMLGMQKDPNLQAGIDKSADDADAKLTALVSNYDMEKPFDVPREKQGGSLLGF